MLAVFVPLIISSGGNSGSQASTLVIPASASAPLVATLVDVTGLVTCFSIASVVLRGALW